MTLFNAMDANGNGEIDWNEALTYTKANSKLLSGKQNDIQEFFDKFDTNKDGKVQREEWVDFYSKVFDSVIGDVAK